MTFFALCLSPFASFSGFHPLSAFWLLFRFRFIKHIWWEFCWSCYLITVHQEYNNGSNETTTKLKCSLWNSIWKCIFFLYVWMECNIPQQKHQPSQIYWNMSNKSNIWYAFVCLCNKWFIFHYWTNSCAKPKSIMDIGADNNDSCPFHFVWLPS